MTDEHVAEGYQQWSDLTPGRIVHFVDADRHCLPAMILIAERANYCKLRVFATNKGEVDRFLPTVNYADSTEQKPLTWHWPLEHSAIAAKQEK